MVLGFAGSFSRFNSVFGFGAGGVLLDFAGSFSRFHCLFDFGGSIGVAIGSCESIDAALSKSFSDICANTFKRVGSGFFLFNFFFNFGGVVVVVA